MRHTNRIGILLAVIALAGCAEGPREDFFEDHGHLTSQILEAQAARGARADATLNGTHFEGSALSCAGRAKLELMLRDGEASLPLVVYLDLPAETDLTPARQAAVREYLSDVGLLASQVVLQSGPNPATLHPAVAGPGRPVENRSEATRRLSAGAELGGPLDPGRK